MTLEAADTKKEGTSSYRVSASTSQPAPCPSPLPFGKMGNSLGNVSWKSTTLSYSGHNSYNIKSYLIKTNSFSWCTVNKRILTMKHFISDFQFGQIPCNACNVVATNSISFKQKIFSHCEG